MLRAPGDNLPGSNVPVPAGWPSIKTTYDTTLGDKIQKAKKDKVPKADVIAGIDYWIARLNEDRASVVANY